MQNQSAPQLLTSEVGNKIPTLFEKEDHCNIPLGMLLMNWRIQFKTTIDWYTYNRLISLPFFVESINDRMEISTKINSINEPN